MRAYFASAFAAFQPPPPYPSLPYPHPSSSYPYNNLRYLASPVGPYAGVPYYHNLPTAPSLPPQPSPASQVFTIPTPHRLTPPKQPVFLPPVPNPNPTKTHNNNSTTHTNEHAHSQPSPDRQIRQFIDNSRDLISTQQPPSSKTQTRSPNQLRKTKYSSSTKKQQQLQQQTSTTGPAADGGSKDLKYQALCNAAEKKRKGLMKQVNINSSSYYPSTYDNPLIYYHLGRIHPPESTTVQLLFFSYPFCSKVP